MSWFIVLMFFLSIKTIFIACGQRSWTPGIVMVGVVVVVVLGILSRGGWCPDVGTDLVGRRFWSSTLSCCYVRKAKLAAMYCNGWRCSCSSWDFVKSRARARHRA